MADPEPARGPAQVTAPLRADRTTICAAPVRIAAMPTQRPHADSRDRARAPGGGWSGVQRSRRCPAAKSSADRPPARRAWLRAERAAALVPSRPEPERAAAVGAMTTGTGGGGGSAVVCPPLACPEIFCPWSRALDDRGCETCACRIGPGPNDCEDVLCFDPRPPPPASCPDAKISCVPGGDRCVWAISVAECKPPTPCPAAECGPIFIDLPPPPCHDGTVQQPTCTRDPDATCRWHFTDCPPSCVALATRETCDRVAGCQWLIRACAEPTLPATGCIDKRDLGCSSQCVAPRRCARIYVDSCTFTTSPPGASCDDAVCRDTTTAVCAWW